jgi:hypothetical protein
MLKTTLFSRVLLSCALSAATYGQGRHDWQSLARLHPGDRVRVVLKTGPVEGEFQRWTPQEATFGTVTAKREEVLKIERYRHGGSRGEHAAVGALIGFGGGFAIGASVTGGCGDRTLGSGGIGPCATRPEGGAIVGGMGAVIGAIIGVLLPTHSKELIYSSGRRGSSASNQTAERNDGGSIAAYP